MSKREGLEGIEALGPLGWLLGPVLFIAENIADQAEEALYDEKPVISELTRLGADLDAGRMTEEDFYEQEAVLLEKLEWITEQKEARNR